MWEFICPRCQKEASKNSHACPHCGEKYLLPLRVPPYILKNLGTLEGMKTLEEYVHKHIFPIISEEYRFYLTQYFTILFNDGQVGSTMETASDFSAWTGTFGTPTIVALAHHGANCASCNATAEFLSKTLASAAETYDRVYINLSAMPANNTEAVEFLRMRKISPLTSLLRAMLLNVAGTVVWRMEYWTGALTGANSNQQTNPSPNTWYCVECRVKCSTTVGEYHMWVNGSELTDIAQTGKNTVQTTFDQYLHGEVFSNYVVTVLTDCVVISDAPIGPEVEKAKLILMGHKPHTLWTTYPHIGR